LSPAHSFAKTANEWDTRQENGVSQRMLDVLMRGLSTRQYAEVLPEMASTCEVSKSTVSREAAKAGEAALQNSAGALCSFA
jgi:transposase-like protein